MDKKFIINFLQTHKQELQSQFGLQKIGLFGSYARDEQTFESDIDIAVEIESVNKFRSFFGLKQYLENNFNKKVDLGIESTFKPIAKGYMMKDIIYV